MNEEATVFVVDDDLGALRSMRWLLESDGLAVETYSSGREFLESYDADRTGCALLDLKMPGLDGLELQNELGPPGMRLPVIFITGHGDVSQCAAAMKAGALHFFEKPVDSEVVLSTVRQALEHDAQRRRVEASRPEIATRLGQLTPRERQAMLLMRKGKETKDIAARLGISNQTAAKHRSRVLKKMKVINEAELVLLLSDHSFDR